MPCAAAQEADYGNDVAAEKDIWDDVAELNADDGQEIVGDDFFESCKYIFICRSLMPSQIGQRIQRGMMIGFLNCRHRICLRSPLDKL